MAYPPALEFIIAEAKIMPVQNWKKMNTAYSTQLGDLTLTLSTEFADGYHLINLLQPPARLANMPEPSFGQEYVSLKISGNFNLCIIQSAYSSDDKLVQAYEYIRCNVDAHHLAICLSERMDWKLQEQKQ